MHAPSPSSSTTTPSPSLSFLHPPVRTVPSDVLPSAELDPQEREERQHAAKKLLARAEFSKLTRSLRARLAYASYKATHNLEHVPLPVLEHRLHTPSPSPPNIHPAPPQSPYHHKRRAADAMPPPAVPAPSLYSSLLGPPPSKRPRHVYGPTEATPPRKKQQQRPPPSPAPFGQGRTVRTVLQGRARSNVTEKEDMNAAATLTALMFKGASPRASGRHDAVGVLAAPVRTATPTPTLASTPKATEDADAAELMLYLATSPSPVRPSAIKRTPGSAAAGMGRVLFPSGRERSVEREPTPGLTASQGTFSSSQDTTVSASLLPPPPSPSPQKKFDLDVSRRLFEDTAGTGGGGGGFRALGKGIDLVEAK